MKSTKCFSPLLTAEVRLIKREKYVIETLHTNKLPTVVTMGGGYAPDIDVIIQGHSVVFGVVGEILG